MKGVIGTRAPGHQIVDLSHGVPPQDVFAGALVLAKSAPFFPKGTIHVAVVDPGVGSDRAALCIETKSAFFVGPDNGVLTLAAPANARLRAFALENPRFHLSPRSATFHGRDVFAPVAAALATGVSPAELGPEVPVAVDLEWEGPVAEHGALTGRVVYVDGFGNLVTNIPSEMLPPEHWTIHVGHQVVCSPAATYAVAPPHAAVGVVGSWGLLEIAIRNGSARETLRAGVGTPVRVVRE